MGQIIQPHRSMQSVTLMTMYGPSDGYFCEHILELSQHKCMPDD